MARTVAPDLTERIRPLKLMAFDVDGVLTDGRLYYANDGSEFKSFHTHDGQGIRLLRDAGLKIALITARRSELVERRGRELGVHFCLQGVEAKQQAFVDVLDELNLVPAQAGYMGDDLLDLPVLTRAGFAAAVPTSPAEVRARCHYVSQRLGGEGAVREVCELILSAQGAYDRLVSEYLR
jgi:3-deoxy-D-manno-octulosonate 8-phosphate phosphatase (KDO 8-P phosphatase)